MLLSYKKHYGFESTLFRNMQEIFLDNTRKCKTLNSLIQYVPLYVDMILVDDIHQQMTALSWFLDMIKYDHPILPKEVLNKLLRLWNIETDKRQYYASKVILDLTSYKSKMFEDFSVIGLFETVIAKIPEKIALQIASNLIRLDDGYAQLFLDSCLLEKIPFFLDLNIDVVPYVVDVTCAFLHDSYSFLGEEHSYNQEILKTSILPKMISKFENNDLEEYSLLSFLNLFQAFVAQEEACVDIFIELSTISSFIPKFMKYVLTINENKLINGLIDLIQTIIFVGAEKHTIYLLGCGLLDWYMQLLTFCKSKTSVLIINSISDMLIKFPHMIESIVQFPFLSKFVHIITEEQPPFMLKDAIFHFFTAMFFYAQSEQMIYLINSSIPSLLLDFIQSTRPDDTIYIQTALQKCVEFGFPKKSLDENDDYKAWLEEVYN